MGFILRRTRQKIVTALVSLILITALAQTSSGQQDLYERWENGVSEAWWFADRATLAKEITAAQSRWKLIEIENATAATNEWAGDYFIGGETHGRYLRWAPRNGFVLMNVDKCQAMVMSLDYGKAAASTALIQFFPELDHQSTGSHTHSRTRTVPNKLLPVKWRGVHYLIPESELADFNDYLVGLGKYNGGSYIESSEFYYKLNDREEGSAQDVPILPPGFERFIRKPIVGQITAVRAGYRKKDSENEWWDDFIIPVTINVGNSEGVRANMTFRVPGSEGLGGMEEKVSVRRVGLHSSQGIIVRTVRKNPCVKIDEDDDCGGIEYPSIKAGWAVTTSPF
ncbi:MAG TPA: hypothetical protein VJT09_17740 [Pyrinomonadaceae bacterium]|nr:hypothetical protein [Pyrinomonadaceae bacterium]